MTIRRYEISDFEWAIIAPLLPNKPRRVARAEACRSAARSLSAPFLQRAGGLLLWPADRCGSRLVGRQRRNRFR
jgi:transposase